MITRWSTMLAVLLASLDAQAVTITWDCNTEPDLLEYRLERSRDNAAWGVVKTVAHQASCQTLTTQDGSRLVPLQRYYYRLFAIDRAKNSSPPSPTTDASQIVIPSSPISGAGGITEDPLPPSPWSGATPPPPVVTPPPSWSSPRRSPLWRR